MLECPLGFMERWPFKGSPVFGAAAKDLWAPRGSVADQNDHLSSSRTPIYAALASNSGSIVTGRSSGTVSANVIRDPQVHVQVTRIQTIGDCAMKLTELLLAELDREAVGIRKTLERVPEGKNDWKPHEKSMPLGSLATIVAPIPAWLDMVVNMEELDINPPGGPKLKPQPWKTRNDLLEQFEASLNKGREVLRKTTDDRLLNTKWRMLAAGKLMSEQPRYVAIRDGVFNHMAHHRGQLTVYLRLNEEKVPAIYGPSADEGKG